MKNSVTNAPSVVIAWVMICVVLLPAGAARAGALWFIDDGLAAASAQDGSYFRPLGAIQDAIDAAADGDTIIVRDGTYTGTGNTNIDFRGKAVALCSQNGPANCVIDCGGCAEEPRRGFRFHGGEGPSTVVAGFTITNGYHRSGGAVCCRGSSPTIINNVITGNRAEDDGGAIFCEASWAYVGNNTVVGNSADGHGGAIACCGSRTILAGNILWANIASRGSQVALSSSEDHGSVLWVAYCDLAGGRAKGYVGDDCTFDWGEGNFDADPLFALPGGWDDNGTPRDATDDAWIAGDYHLRSEHGRWDPAANDGAGGWAGDAATSPCIDAGGPHWSYSNEPQPDGFRANIGAYGNTAQASRNIRWNKPGDADGDGKADLDDLKFIRGRLGQNPADGDNWKADLNEDGKINILDLIVVRNRLKQRPK